MIKVRIFTYYIVKSVKIPMVSDNLMLQFKDDAYLPADEPLGSIEATLSLITFLAFALLIWYKEGPLFMRCGMCWNFWILYLWSKR